jgi:uncharacterized membrane protein HdeD (DUF308 family)
MLASICKHWRELVFRGVLAVIFGVVTIMWPGISLRALIGVFAAFTFLDGVFGIAAGLKGGPEGKVWWPMLLMGVLAIGAGIATLAWPGLTALILLAIIAASAIMRGILQISAAISLRKQIDDEWVLGLSGTMSILFGILLIARPSAGALAVVLLIGAYMLALGIMEIALGMRMRRVSNKISSIASAT